MLPFRHPSKLRCCVQLGLVVTSTWWKGPATSSAFFVRGHRAASRLVLTNTHNDENTFFSSSDINGSGDEETDPGTPLTGWNHNLPSKSSKFWQKSGDDTSSSSNLSNDNTPSPLRTGWLHNTQAPSKIKTTDANDEKKPPTNLARQRLEMAQLQQQRNHRIVSPPALHAAGGDKVAVVTEHVLSVPLYHCKEKDSSRNDDDKRIDVYFSIVELLQQPNDREFFTTTLASLSPRQRADAYVNQHPRALSLTDAAKTNPFGRCLLYLQGGPGFGAPTPVAGLGVNTPTASWAAAALHTCGYDRIVLMDQRGTGRSTPITQQTLELRFPGLTTATSNDPVVATATEFMAQFRADNIVYDAEAIRKALLVVPLDDVTPAPPAPWGCSLGQSYGGFCSLTYLSLIPHPPQTMLLTGGIPPVLENDLANDVYSKLWDRVRTRNLRYYAMYPDDVRHVQRIVRRLLRGPSVELPSGGKLTARRFLLLGIQLGGSPSSFAAFHELITSNVFVVTGDAEDDEELVFTKAFLKKMDAQMSFDDHPIYYWMHESIYADGPAKSPTNWAAERALQGKQEAFDYTQTCLASSDQPVLFYGEHVFSWMSHDFGDLQGLDALAQALAAKTDWGRLYDTDHMRQVLEDGRTRLAAAVYYEDMYVEFGASMRLVEGVGAPLEKCRVYVTNEYQHSGLRDNGAALFAQLHGMAQGGTRTPS